MITKGLLLGRDKGGSGAHREERENSHRVMVQVRYTHTDEDGGMKVSSLRNMQHGARDPKVTALGNTCQYRCSAPGRQSQPSAGCPATSLPGAGDRARAP